MEEINKKYLQTKLDHIPEVEPPNSLWVEMEERLDFEEQLKMTLPDLPLAEVGRDLWEKLDENLDKKNIRKTKVISIRKVIAYSSSIAAALILIIVAYWGISFAPEEVISYSDEEEIVQEAMFLPSLKDDEALQFINYTCSLQMDICETDEFKKLKEQMDELTIEMDDLSQQLAQNDNNPYLIKAQVKVENMRADITKRLIVIITS